MKSPLPLLTAILFPPLGAFASTKTWDGQGVFERWASGINWVGNDPPVNGDDVIFEVNHSVGYETDNNLPAGTRFRDFTFTNTLIFGVANDGLLTKGWIHRGNAITISGEVRVGTSGTFVSSPRGRIEFPITFVDGPFHVNRHSIGGPLDMLGTISGQAFDFALAFGVVAEAPVSGSGLIELRGSGEFHAANTMTGPIRLSGLHGTQWRVTNPAGLGSTGQPTFVETRTDLFVDAPTCPEPLVFETVLRTPQFPNIARVHFQSTTYSGILEARGPGMPTIGGSGSCLFTQSLRKAAADSPFGAEFNLDAGATCTLTGDQSAVPPANRLGGTLSLVTGTLVLDAPGGTTYDASKVSVNGGVGAVIRWERPNALPATCSADVGEDGTLNLNNQPQTFSSVRLEKAQILSGNPLSVSAPIVCDAPSTGADIVGSKIGGTLRSTAPAMEWNVTSANTFLTVQANVAVGPLGAVPLRKTGSGRAVWSGLASGITDARIQGGVLEYSGNAPSLDIRIEPPTAGQVAGFTARSCSIRDLSVTSTPGLRYSLDCVGGTSQCRNLTLNSSSFIERFVTAGRIGDYFEASGAVTLGGAKFNVQAPFSEHVIGEEYFIVKKTGPGAVAGALVDNATGLPIVEGQLFAPGAGDFIYRFSYAGGDGNDVSLKVVSFVPDGLTRTWTGASGSTLWNNDANWNTAIVTGATCVFPAVANKVAVHNFAAGSPVERIRINADGYSFLGNAIGLLSGIQLIATSTQAVFNTPVLLAENQTFSSASNAHLRLGTTSTGKTDLNGWALTLEPTATSSSIELGAASAGTDPPAVLTGRGSVIKKGLGGVILYAPSDFSGPLNVTQGTLTVARSPSALGSAAADSGTFLAPGSNAVLEFTLPGGTIAEPIVLPEGTVLRSAPTAGNVVLTGPVACSGLVHVQTNALDLSGSLSGSFTKVGPGSLRLLNPLALTTGELTLQDGSVVFGRAAGSNWTGRLRAKPGTTVVLNSPNQLEGQVILTQATFDLNNQDESLPSLDLSDSVVQTGTGTLGVGLIVTAGPLGSTIAGKLAVPAGGVTLSVGNDDAADDLTVSAVVSGGMVRKGNFGVAKLTANNTFSAAEVGGGTLLLNGTNTANVTLAGGTLGGTGSVGTITGTSGGGALSPGASTGIFSCGNVSLTAGTSFIVEANSPVAGTGYDQLNVTGTVNLNGATLTLLPGSSVAGILTIVANDGTDPIVGTFAGLPENAQFSLGGKTFRISYLGGTGNDVTLTVITTGTGVTRTWSGLGSNNQWITPGNWVGGVAPVAGDDLVFPAGVTVKTCNNTFPAGTTFNSISVRDSGYGLAGNSVLLNAGLVFDYPTGLSSVSLDVTLVGPQSFTVLQGAQATVSPNTVIASGGFTLTADVQAPAGRLTLNSLAGTGSLTKTGTGGLTMNASTFSGVVTLNGGETKTGIASGLGTGTSAVVVATGAELRFENMAATTISRPISLSGKLEFASSPITLSGAITLPSAGLRTVEVEGATPSLTGIVGGSGGIAKTGSGALTIGGSGANTFSGGCTVTAGSLRLGKASNALPGPVTIGNGATSATVLFLASNQIGNSAVVSLVGSGAQLQCGSFTDAIDSLHLTGGSVTGTGSLTVNGFHSHSAATTGLIDAPLTLAPLTAEISVEDGPASPDLSVAGDIVGDPSLSLDRYGAGTLMLTAGAAVVAKLNDGLTLIAKDWSTTEFILNGGNLGGTGPVGTVSAAAGGAVMPGSSTGILQADRFDGNASTVLTMEIGGTVPGTQHDQLVVNGVADPQNAILSLVPIAGWLSVPGTQYVLIDNLDTARMPSEFFKLEEGTTFAFGGAVVSVSYNGGDGNDLVLTVVRIDATGNTRTWDGGGADANWTTAANWEDDTAPVAGDNLVFPTGVAKKITANTFPAQTNFNRIAVADGYFLNGNALTLSAGLERLEGATSDPATVNTAITCVAPQSINNLVAGTTLVLPRIDVGPHAVHFNAAATAALGFVGPLAGQGPLICAGGGNFSVSAAPTAAGALSVEGSQLTLNGVNLGGISTVSLASSALSSPGATAVTVTQPVAVSASTVSASVAPLTLSGIVTVTSGELRLSAPGANAAVILSSRIQGAGDVFASDGTRIRFSGSLANTFAGRLTVGSTRLELAKTAGVTAVPGNITAVGAAEVRWFSANQIADSATVDGFAVLDLNGFSETVNTIRQVNGAVSTGAGTLTLGGDFLDEGGTTLSTIDGQLNFSGPGLHTLKVADATAADDLHIDAAISAPSGVTVRKTGAGTVTFAGVCAMGDFQIGDGQVNWNGASPLTAISLDGSTATLAGTGSAGSISSLAGGTVSPGASPGLLGAGSVAWNAATTYRVGIDGTAAGTDFDVIAASGPVALGNATLDLQFGFTPAIGSSFAIVTGATALTGNFAGLPDQAFFSRPGGLVFQISYAGGKATVTRVNAIPTSIDGLTLAPATGANVGNDQVDVSGTGVPGVGHRLQWSDDLSLWVDADTVSAQAGSGAILFEFIQPPTVERRFFRIVVP